jgi:hypothetical protein
VKRPMFVEVQGKSGTYVFPFKGDPANVADWRADGLTVQVIEYTVPYWVVDIGLMRPWCALQKAWRFLLP